MAEGADMAARRGRDGDGMIEGLLELDLDRSRRRGAPEAVLTDAKTVEQVGAIAAEYARLHASGREDLGPVLFTRADRQIGRASCREREEQTLVAVHEECDEQ